MVTRLVELLDGPVWANNILKVSESLRNAIDRLNFGVLVNS